MHKHIKEKMKKWDIEQEATVMEEGTVEVMGQDTHIRAIRPDA